MILARMTSKYGAVYRAATASRCCCSSSESRMVYGLRLGIDLPAGKVNPIAAAVKAQLIYVTVLTTTTTKAGSGVLAGVGEPPYAVGGCEIAEGAYVELLILWSLQRNVEGVLGRSAGELVVRHSWAMLLMPFR
jgi:hypothetical protein